MRIELDRIWTDVLGQEIAGDQRRSKEVGRILPNFADLRSISPASTGENTLFMNKCNVVRRFQDIAQIGSRTTLYS
eukprot:7189986-Prymnesium_polylepis.1